MQTEKLNEYIFANLLQEYAQQARRRRQHKMEIDGVSNEEIVNTPITMDDLREGYKTLDWYRVESLKLLQE